MYVHFFFEFKQILFFRAPLKFGQCDTFDMRAICLLPPETWRIQCTYYNKLHTPYEYILSTFQLLSKYKSTLI